MKNFLTNRKILLAIIIVTSLIGYLEWGTSNATFLYQAEMEIFQKLLADPLAVIHPFTTLPMLGQLLLFVAIFVKKTNKVLISIGLCCIGILLVFIFLIGCYSLHTKMIFSTLPFLLVSSYMLRKLFKNEL